MKTEERKKKGARRATGEDETTSLVGGRRSMQWQGEQTVDVGLTGSHQEEEEEAEKKNKASVPFF